MPTRVLLTIDTEFAYRHYRPGAGWEELFALSWDPAGVGVPYQLDLLARHGLKACFFVDPMPAVRYGLEPIRRMVGPILEAGQEVQLHLHPFWLGIGDEPRPARRIDLPTLCRGMQRDLIRDARDLLIAAGAPPPIAFRAGSYAANAATLEGLADLGIRYDSSHNGSHHPSPSALPLDPAQIGPLAVGEVIEVPVTQIEDRPGRLRHLQLCAVSGEELRAALTHAVAERHPLVTIVSHSFELASRDGRRANRALCRRFEALCAFLAGRRDALATVHFADLGALPLGAEARPLPSHSRRTARRLVEQFWSNAVYERSL